MARKQRSDYVVWKVVETTLGKFNVQVQVDFYKVDQFVHDLITANPKACGLEAADGSTIVRLTRQP